MKKAVLAATLFFMGLSIQSFGQKDSLIFENGDVIVGEIKSMDRGVLTIEPDYSDSDFKIKWVDIREIYTESRLLISTTDGRRLYGILNTAGDNLALSLDGGGIVLLGIQDIVSVKSVDNGFWDRLYAGIDLGFTLTRARNQRQFTLRSRGGYLAERWSIDASYNSLISKQDETEDIERIDGNLAFRYVLPHEWFLVAQLDYLSNTEQLLDARTNFKAGIGKYIFRTNQWYWGIQTGVSQNEENYSGVEGDRSSQEYWLGTEFNLYDIGDLSLLTNVVIYPSLSEDDRFRTDFKIDLKYDFPLDFYIKTGYTLNYDNQPAEGGVRSDYVWQTTIGWEW